MNEAWYEARTEHCKQMNRMRGLRDKHEDVISLTRATLRKFGVLINGRMMRHSYDFRVRGFKEWYGDFHKVLLVDALSTHPMIKIIGDSNGEIKGIRIMYWKKDNE